MEKRVPTSSIDKKSISIKECEYADFIDYLINKIGDKTVDDMFSEFLVKYGYENDKGS